MRLIKDLIKALTIAGKRDGAPRSMTELTSGCYLLKDTRLIFMGHIISDACLLLLLARRVRDLYETLNTRY